MLSFEMTSSRKLCTPNDYAEILSRYDTWLFDCDGVIWSGDDAIEGASQAIEFLRKNEKKIIFVTNNAARSRKMLKKKFDRLGFAASEVRPKPFPNGPQTDQPGFLNRMKLYPVLLPPRLISKKC